jgi:general secretion pathway protein L
MPFDIPVHSFFSWWGEELGTFVPDGLKRLLGQTTEYLLVKKDQTATTLSLVSTKSIRELGKVTNDDADLEDVNAVKQLMQNYPELASAEVVLELKPQQVLTREIKLPLAAKKNLHQVVAYELDRYTPFTADQVYYDVQITGKDTETGLLTAQLALIPKQNLDDLCEELIACELHPTVARLTDNNGSTPRFNLLPTELRPTKNSLPKILSFAIGLLLSLLLLGLLLVPQWFQQRIIDDLEQELDVVSKVANEVQTLKKRVETQLQETNYLLDKKRTQPVVLHMFDDLPKRIPDTTWLTYMQYKNGDLQIRGESPDASSLIALVEASPMFKNTQFVSPVTRSSASNTDRFQLKIEVLNGGVFDRKSK